MLLKPIVFILFLANTKGLIYDVCNTNGDCSYPVVCKANGCKGYNCLCPVNYVTDISLTRCVIASSIGAYCNDTTRCLSRMSICENNICKCTDFFRTTEDGSCTFQELRVVGENCTNSIQCADPYAICTATVCGCAPGHRMKSPKEIWADPLSTTQCVLTNSSLEYCGLEKLPSPIVTSSEMRSVVESTLIKDHLFITVGVQSPTSVSPQTAIDIVGELWTNASAYENPYYFPFLENSILSTSYQILTVDTYTIDIDVTDSIYTKFRGVTSSASESESPDEAPVYYFTDTEYAQTLEPLRLTSSKKSELQYNTEAIYQSESAYTLHLASYTGASTSFLISEPNSIGYIQTSENVILSEDRRTPQLSYHDQTVTKDMWSGSQLVSISVVDASDCCAIPREATSLRNQLSTEDSGYLLPTTPISKASDDANDISTSLLGNYKDSSTQLGSIKISSLSSYLSSSNRGDRGGSGSSSGVITKEDIRIIICLLGVAVGMLFILSVTVIMFRMCRGSQLMGRSNSVSPEPATIAYTDSDSKKPITRIRERW